MLIPSVKKISLGIASVAFLSLLIGCQTNTGNLYGYDFQTAKITYKITGSSEGSSLVLIKGEKKIIKNIITQTNADGTKSTANSTLIQNGDQLYRLDPATKKVSQVTNPMYAQLKVLTPEQRNQKMVEEALQGNGNSDTENQSPSSKQEMISGQSCHVYTGKITTTCLWGNIPLKTVTSLSDYGIQTETTATNIELNQTIADSAFDIPSDYQITKVN